MQSFEIVKKSTINESFRNNVVKSSFGIESSEVKEVFKGILDLPEKWNVGLIYGGSGTGKSTIINELFNQKIIKSYDYDNTKSVIDNMPDHKSLDEIYNSFYSIGFGSIPSWLKPYHVLSNGEKMRVDVARALLDTEDVVVIDEFTSVVDREVAKLASFAISKHVKKLDKQFIGVSCHKDILEWLEPDWVFCTDTMTFTRGLLRRPKINIQIKQCSRNSWAYFKKYHYISEEIPSNVHCFVALYNNTPVGFTAIRKFTHPTVKNMYKFSRSVVLPEYQGFGISKLMIETIAEMYSKQGYRVTRSFSHPKMYEYCMKSPKWKCINKGRGTAPASSTKFDHRSVHTIQSSFEYIP